MSTFGKPPFPPEKKTTADFEYIYNPDGTCAARYDCGAPGVVLAYDEFSPECATWFCGDCWEELGIATPMFVIVEDKRPNPQTNHNRLYHSIGKAETEAEKLNRETEAQQP